MVLMGMDQRTTHNQSIKRSSFLEIPDFQVIGSMLLDDDINFYFSHDLKTA